MASPNVGVIAAAPGLVPKVGTDEDPKPRINNELPPVAVFTAGDIEGAFGWAVSGVDPNLDKEEEPGVPKMDLVVAAVTVVVGVIPNAGVVDVASGLTPKPSEGAAELLNEKTDCLEAAEVPDVICDWVTGAVTALLLAGAEDDEVICPVVFKEDRLKLKPELLPPELCPGKENPPAVDAPTGCVGTAEIEGLVTEAFRLKLAAGCGLKLNWEGAFDVSANPVFVVDVAAAVIGAERADARKLWPT